MLAIRNLPRVEVLETEARRFKALDPAAVLAYLSVVIVAADLERTLDTHFSRYGLSQARFVILMALRHQPDHTATPATLATHASVKRATITGLLDGLEKDGFVARGHRSDDRRSLHVRLTKKGVTLIERILPDHYKRIGVLMGDLKKSEMKELTVLLGKVRRGITATQVQKKSRDDHDGFSSHCTYRKA